MLNPSTFKLPVKGQSCMQDFLKKKKTKTIKRNKKESLQKKRKHWNTRVQTFVKVLAKVECKST